MLSSLTSVTVLRSCADSGHACRKASDKAQHIRRFLNVLVKGRVNRQTPALVPLPQQLGVGLDDCPDMVEGQFPGDRRSERRPRRFRFRGFVVVVVVFVAAASPRTRGVLLLFYVLFLFGIVDFVFNLFVFVDKIFSRIFISIIIIIIVRGRRRHCLLVDLN